MLTALGFNTKSSIAGIKNAKNISNLEKDFLKISTNIQSFPVLKDIKTFTPGMKSMLLVVVNHLNLSTKTKCVDDAETVALKMFDQAKKVRLFFIYSSKLCDSDYFSIHLIFLVCSKRSAAALQAIKSLQRMQALALFARFLAQNAPW